LAYQIRIYGCDKNAALAVPTVTAFYPVNFQVDSGTASGFYSDSSLSALGGAVTYQDGARNVGQWVRWPQMQFAYGTTDAQTSEAGSLITNHSSASVSASYRIEISVRLKFFKRCLLPGLSTIQNPVPTLLGFETVEHKDILLSGDVEQNPGPDDDEEEESGDEPN
jgi:hypothetical protein